MIQNTVHLNTCNLMTTADGNYLKVIYELSRQKGCVFSVDIANAMGYSRPSIYHAVRKLINLGYVILNNDKSIELTQSGESKARKVREAHDVIFEFLTATLQVDQEVAHNDASKIEHLISDETLNKIKLYLEKKEGK